MPVRDEDYKDALRSEQRLRHALATIVNALDAMGEHTNLVRIGQKALADDCSSCDGSGSAGEWGCTDCLGTGVDPSSIAGVALPITEREEAKRARPPSDGEPWVVADDTGLRLTFREEDAAWRYREQHTDRLVNPTVTHEPASTGALPTHGGQQ